MTQHFRDLIQYTAYVPRTSGDVAVWCAELTTHAATFAIRFRQFSVRDDSLSYNEINAARHGRAPGKFHDDAVDAVYQELWRAIYSFDGIEGGVDGWLSHVDYKLGMLKAAIDNYIDNRDNVALAHLPPMEQLNPPIQVLAEHTCYHMPNPCVGTARIEAWGLDLGLDLV